MNFLNLRQRYVFFYENKLILLTLGENFSEGKFFIKKSKYFISSLDREFWKKSIDNLEIY